MTPRQKAIVYLLIAAAIWGVASPVIKYTLSSFDPIIFLTYRFLLSSLILIPILFITQPRILHTLSRLTPKNYLFIIIGSLFGSTVNLGFLFWGYSLTTTLDASIISAISPVIVALAGHYLLREQVTHRERLGLVLSLVGSVVILLQPLLDSGVYSSGSITGNFLVMLANLAWVGYVIISKKQLRFHLSPLFLTTAMFFIGFVSMSIILVFTRTNYQLLSTVFTAPLSAHLGVIYMAALSGGLAYWLYEKGQKTIEASEANVFLYLSPLITTPLAHFWLGEPIAITFLVGSLIITIGVIFAQTKANRT